jgi:hypothetical protein
MIVIWVCAETASRAQVYNGCRSSRLTVSRQQGQPWYGLYNNQLSALARLRARLLHAANTARAAREATLDGLGRRLAETLVDRLAAVRETTPAIEQRLWPNR